MTAQRVAFVCLHGSAKSLIAAEQFNRLAKAKGLAWQATTSGPEPDAAVPDNVIAGCKTHEVDVRNTRPVLVTSEQLKGANLIVSFACDAGRKLAPQLKEERWDDCPAVSDD